MKSVKLPSCAHFLFSKPIANLHGNHLPTLEGGLDPPVRLDTEALDDLGQFEELQVEFPGLIERRDPEVCPNVSGVSYDSPGRVDEQGLLHSVDFR